MDVIGEMGEQQIAERAVATPVGADGFFPAHHPHGAVGKGFKRHGLRRGAHVGDDLGQNVLTGLLDIDHRLSGARGCKFTSAHRLIGDRLAVEQHGNEVRLADLAVAQCRVRLGRVVVGEHHRAACVRPQAMQHRREVRVSRQDHEFVEERLMGEDVADIHDDADIG